MNNRNILSLMYRTLSVIFFLVAVLPGISHGPLQAAESPTQSQSAAPTVDSMQPLRQTTEGVVTGVVQKATNTLSWKAIPYARPPVGELRWMAPQPPEKRSAPLKTDAYCEICPQYIDHDGNPATPQIIAGTEDCLYLNIWRPRTKAVDLPVFFWIHGGGNSVQWPLASDTDGAFLANRQNVIVVTVNYRLGPLGFFSHPALHQGMAGETGTEKTDSGNFAILDLIQALTWIKANIKTFGGDPGNVTIAGESAGASNVLSLLVSPLAKDLFQRAMSQSAAVRPSTPTQGAAHAESVMAKLFVKDGKARDEQTAIAMVKEMPPKELEAYLRSKTAQDFLDTYREGKMGGMIRFPTGFGDGKVLPADFYEALKSGQYHKVPLILGSNKEEAKLFLMLGNPAFKTWQRDGSLFKDPVRAELYDLVAKYQSDGWKVMAVDQPARFMRQHKDQPAIYAYQFLWGAGGLSKSVLPFPFSLLTGASHATEIDFVFGTEAVALGGLAFTDQNRPGRLALSQAIMDYWGQFARTGNPNREGSRLPEWKPWSNGEGTPKTLLLDADFKALNVEMSEQELTNEAIIKDLKEEKRTKEIEPFWEASPYRSSVR